jgi:DNA-binding XRE family transcriptional regulator
MGINSKMTNKSLRQIEKLTGGKLTLGKLIWAIRTSDGETQVGFADKLDISKQHLCDLEHDRKSISPKLAASYAKKLGYSKEQFIRLCLQDLVDRAGLKVIIEVKPEFARAG